MHRRSLVTMRLSIAFLALIALAAAVPVTPHLHAADQEILKKQQDVILLLENIVGELPDEHLHEIGKTYEFEHHLDGYENPAVVKYYVGLVKTGHVQPKGTPFSVSISQLRKEVALLTQILMGAKDYETFLHTAAWARVHVNQDQFVKAFSSAVIARLDMYGVILPPAYEVFPHYFFDTRIIQKVHDYMHQHALEHHEHGRNVHYVHVNYTSYLPFGENEIAYLTEDIGLNTYYSYIMLAGYMMPMNKHGEDIHHKHGHGAHFYYLHQQLLARYNLERLGQGLDPIKELDYYYEHIETPFKPHLRYLNGVNFPGRDEHLYITPHHHNYELIKLIRTLERRIIDAVDHGHVITPQGAFLSLYQPEGLNILGDIIEATGHSINPRYYGNFAGIAKQLLGNVPEFNDIWEYTPSALELAQTSLRDPMFYQLYSKIMEFFHHYQEALPAYHYHDLVVPGVTIEKVEVDELVTYFSDYEVDMSNAVPLPVGHHEENQHYPTVKAHLKRLNHKPYEYAIHINAEKPVPGAVVRLYVGPKYNYDGQPIDINEHRHYFFELDQFFYDLTEGHNVIMRNSRQAIGHSFDWPTIEEMKERIQSAVRSEHPYYVLEPQQLYGFPARLSLPKGTEQGYPLQLFVIITSGIHHQRERYGPVVDEEWMTYQPQHYEIVDGEEYLHKTEYPVDKVHGGCKTVEVVPHFEAQIITEGNWHWGYLYKKYPGSYYYPHWQQTHYNMEHHHPEGHEYHLTKHHHEHHVAEHHHTEHHYPEHHIPVHQYPEHHDPEHHVPVHHYLEHHVPESHIPEHHVPVHHHPEHHVPESHIPEHHVPVHQYPEHHREIHHGEELKGKLPYVYQHMTKTPEGMKDYQTTYRQGMYHGQIEEHHDVNGHYSGEHHMSHPGWVGHDEHVHEYFEHKYIGNLIGGAVTLDGKPLGYPFDRPLAHSAFYVSNIYVKDVVVFHHDQYIPEH